MKNKILVELFIPEIETTYDIFLPINRKAGSVIKLVNKAVLELSDGIYTGGTTNFLYNSDTGEKYEVDKILKATDIRNGTKLILF